MLSSAVLMLVTLVSLDGGEGHQCIPNCDSVFQKKIKDSIWDTYGMPTNILDTGSKSGREYVIFTTAGYYPKGTVCIYTEFEDKGTKIKLVTVGGSVTGEPEEDQLEEHDGVVEEKDSHVKRVHIYSKDGIVAWYRCVDNGPSGPFQVAMKIKEGAYVKDNVDKVKSLIEEKLEIELKDSFAHECETGR